MSARDAWNEPEATRLHRLRQHYAEVETWLGSAWGEIERLQALLGTACDERDALEELVADLLAEHKRWAEEFGDALILALQGDYSRVDIMAREMPVDFRRGVPYIRSAAIAKAEGRTEEDHDG